MYTWLHIVHLTPSNLDECLLHFRKIFNTLSLSVESPGGGLEDVGGVETSSLVMTLGIDPTIQQDAQVMWLNV